VRYRVRGGVGRGKSGVGPTGRGLSDLGGSSTCKIGT
jgi:hypothetical protein